MMTLLRSFAVLVLLAALAVARCRAQKNTTSCLESLDSVFLAERDVEDESILRSYVLCPNTTFSIASAFNESGGPIEGQYPLKIARSNIHVLCGEDGSSANECVLEGGMEQLVFVDLYESNHSVTNVLVQGLTFSKAKTRNAAVKNKGQLSLVDCIFKVPCASPRWSFRQFASTSHPHSVAPHQDNNNRKLIEVSEEDVELDVLLNISECVFSDNQVWSFSALTIEGLVSVYGGTVHLSHSVFVRNTIAESETTKLEYAVGLYHGSLALDNTCFLDNDDRLAPLAREGGELKVFSSSVQRNSTTLPVSACGFVSDGDLGRYGFNASGFSCQKADSPVCTASALAKVEPSCYRSFSEIDYNEEFLDSDDTTRTYRLCENHTYQIRNFDADDDDRENTTTPLIVGRSNVNILCGASGSSRNNCTLHGGTYQFTVHDEYRVGTTFQNVLVQGLTFKAATTYNFLTSTNNDVTLKDCVFTENRNQATILVDLSSTEFERVVWNRETSEQVDSANEKPNLVLTVADSLFLDNVVGVARGGNAGVITNHKGNVRILSSSFHGTRSVEEGWAMNMTEWNLKDIQVTESNDDPSQFVTYVVGNIEGNMELYGNCFFENHATIAPVLSYKGTLSESRNGGTESPSIAKQETCEFVAEVLFPDVPESSGQGSTPLSSDVEYACVEFDVKNGCASPTMLNMDDMPRGVSSGGTVVDSSGISETNSSSTQRPGNAALYCIVALIGAFFILMLVIASYNLRRSASPLRLPTFRSDPIPPIL